MVKTVQAIINGQTYNLNFDDLSGKWQTTITAPSKSSYTQDEHYYPVQIKATDDAGNVTEKDDTDSVLGESLRLKVVEKNPPQISVTSPTNGAHINSSTPQIQWTVTDDDSGVNPDTISLTIDSVTTITTEIQKSPTEGGYTCTYTPSSLDDGIHVLNFNAQDYDENAAQLQTVSFTVDTVPPVLTITSPTDNLVTNNPSLTVSGTTNDVTSNPVTLTVKLNSAEPQTVEVQENGNFSYEVTLSEGVNTIVVTATDSSGKSTEIQRTVTLSTSAPVITEVSIVPNPVDAGQTFIISVTVTDD